LDLDAHALPDLAGQRQSVGLTLLHFAAGELPQPGQHSLRTPLGDQVAIAARDHGRNDAQVGGVGHDGPPYCGITCSMVKRVTPVEADALLKEGWTYLDVRSIPEFEGGHPAGAVNVPLLHMMGGRVAPNPACKSVVEGNFAKDAKLCVGCKMGGRSAQAAALLE